METNEQWSARFSRQLVQIEDLNKKKRNDYTGGKHPLENYRRSAAVINVTAPQIMLSRIQEKVTRAGNLMTGTKQKVMDESLADSLLDIAVIALLIKTELEGEDND